MGIGASLATSPSTEFLKDVWRAGGDSWGKENYGELKNLMLKIRYDNGIVTRQISKSVK